jgi:radical SAM protein with 4Fe4S-binding SPASM domain
VREVYLQRLVFCEETPFGMATPDQALFERLTQEEQQHLAAAETQAAALGISFNASGASEPGESLARKTDENPWSLCRRPWTVMYFTANGRALPCCIAPFSQAGYENYTLGDATRQTIQEIWNSRAYREFRAALQSETPPRCCAGCGLRWSL